MDRQWRLCSLILIFRFVKSMNVRILNPKEFKNCSYPTVLEDKLEVKGGSNATAIKFSRKGDYVAIGCYNGTVQVFDFETLTVIREFPQGHNKYRYKGALYEPCVSSLSWMWNETYLLSSGWDRQVVVWDLEKKKVINRLTFNSGVKFVDSHPTDDIFLASPWWDVPYLFLTYRPGMVRKVPLPVEKRCTDPSSDQYDYMVARFDNKGEKIYVGNSYGEIVVLMNNEKLERLSKIVVDEKGSTAIYDISFSKRGHFFLVNSGEVLHLYHSETYYDLGKFHDLVNNSRDSHFQPNAFGFSGYVLVPEYDWDSEYIYACCRGSQSLFVWDRKTAKLVHMLEGPKETVLVADWHPRSPICLVSTSNATLYVWGKTFTEGWSSFAPQFTEVENNEFYTEREDEFDSVDNVQILKNRINPNDILEDGKELIVFEKEKSCFESDEDAEGNRKPNVFLSTRPKERNEDLNERGRRRRRRNMRNRRRKK